MASSGGSRTASLGRRRRLGVAAVALAAGVAVWLGGLAVLNAREAARDRCRATPPGKEHLFTARTSAEWEWTPPGWVCVYRSPGTGRVIARERR